jgi:hypothetical protein
MLTLLATTLTVPATRVEAAQEVKRCPKYEEALRRHKLPVKPLSHVMWRESKCQPKAVGWNYHKGKDHTDCKLSHAKTYRKCKAVKSYDIGLLQINSSWRTVTHRICKTTEMLKLQEVECNLKVAAYLYRNGGIVHWLGSSHKK